MTEKTEKNVVPEGTVKPEQLVKERKEMQIEEYQKLATLLNEALKILYESEKNPLWKYSSKPYFKHWKKTTDAIEIARSESEELMFIDCPEQASIYIFYPLKFLAKE